MEGFFVFECNSKHTSSRLGLDGYLEDLNGQELSPGQEFSVFEGNGVTRIRLDPTGVLSIIRVSRMLNSNMEVQRN